MEEIENMIKIAEDEHKRVFGVLPIYEGMLWNYDEEERADVIWKAIDIGIPYDESLKVEESVVL